MSTIGIKPKDSQRDRLTKRGRERETDTMWHRIDPTIYAIFDRQDHNG